MYTVQNRFVYLNYIYPTYWRPKSSYSPFSAKIVTVAPSLLCHLVYLFSVYQVYVRLYLLVAGAMGGVVKSCDTCARICKPFKEPRNWYSAGGIDSLESIPGLHKRLQIRAQKSVRAERFVPPALQYFFYNPTSRDLLSENKCTEMEFLNIILINTRVHCSF